MIRLIASDLDGTLLDGQGRLPDGCFDMIRALNAQGVRFAAASGRQYGNLKRLFAPVVGDMDFICENGALVVARGEMKAEWFPRDVAEEITRDILNAGMEVLFSAPETCYMLSSASRAFTDDIFYRLRNTCTIIERPADVIGGCIKISGFHPESVIDRAPPIQAKWGGRLHCDVAGLKWLDFTLANKGSGMAVLAEKLHIPLSDMAAFGDQFNDESMLSAVGHPYIMAHAPEALLQKGFTPCRAVMDTLRDILRMTEEGAWPRSS